MDKVEYVSDTLHIVWVLSYIGVTTILCCIVSVTLTNWLVDYFKNKNREDKILERYSQEDILNMFPDAKDYVPKKIKSIIITVEYEDDSLQDIMKEPITVVADRLPLAAMAKAMIDIRDKIVKESKENDAV